MRLHHDTRLQPQDDGVFGTQKLSTLGCELRLRRLLDVLAVEVHRVVGEPVERSASEAFGAEHLGPFGERRDMKCRVTRGSSNRARLCSPRCLGRCRASDQGANLSR